MTEDASRIKPPKVPVSVRVAGKELPETSGATPAFWESSNRGPERGSDLPRVTHRVRTGKLLSTSTFHFLVTQLLGFYSSVSLEVDRESFSLVQAHSLFPGGSQVVTSDAAQGKPES